eukprot:gene37733-biopygen32052
MLAQRAKIRVIWTVSACGGAWGVLRLSKQEREMADEKDESWLGDRSKINLEEEWEVAFWTRKLGLTRDQLEAVVKVAGPVVFDVLKALDA